MNEGLGEEPSDGQISADSEAVSPRKPNLNFVEPSHRFANLREKLKLIRARPNQGKMNFGALTELVEEARFNKSAVVNDVNTTGSELYNILSLSPSKRKAASLRELIEYGRRIIIPTSASMLDRQKRVAWYLCIMRLKLVTIQNKQEIISGGIMGDKAFWLLKGTAVRQSTSINNNLTALDMFGEAALYGKPYDDTVMSEGEVCCATLSRSDFEESLKEAETSTISNSSIKQLRHLMLMSRTERTPSHIQDIQTKLGVFDLFRTMEEDFRNDICGMVEYLSVPEGHTLFQEGDPICFCYVILRGSVSFSKLDPISGVIKELGNKSAGDHFGTLATLSGGEKKRPFSAVSTEECEFAILNRVQYNRFLKKQLQGLIDSRTELISNMAIMRAAPDLIIKRVAFNSQTEYFPAGSMIINPSFYPNKLFFIIDGECKLVWITDDVANVPPVPLSNSQHAHVYHRSIGSNMAMDSKEDVAGARSKSNAVKPSPSRPTTSGASNLKDGDADSGNGNQDLMDQMGNTSSNPVCGCGRQVNHPMPIRRRFNIDVARLGKGDIVNGAVLKGQAPTLAVVAVTNVRMMSMDSDSVESFFGISAFSEVQKIVDAQILMNKERLERIVNVRQAVTGTLMEASQHRSITSDPSSMMNFLEHFVPQGPEGIVQSQTQLSRVGQQPSDSRIEEASIEAPTFEDMCAVQLLTVQAPTKEALEDHRLAREAAIATLKAALNESGTDQLKKDPHHDNTSRDAHSMVEAIENELPMLGSSQLYWPEGTLAPSGTNALNQNPPSTSMAGDKGRGGHHVPGRIFAGNVHAYLGDMMEMLSARPSQSVSVPSATSESSQRFNMKPLSTTASSLFPSSSFAPILMDSPALLSKTLTTPIMSASASKLISGRDHTIISTTQSPSAMSLRSHVEHVSNKDEVNVLPGSMTSYQSILQPEPKFRDKRVEMLHNMAKSTPWGGVKKHPREQQIEEAMARLQRRQLQNMLDNNPKGKEPDNGWKEVRKEGENFSPYTGFLSLDTQPLTLPPSPGPKSRDSFLQSNSALPDISPASRQASRNGAQQGGSFRVRSVRAWQRPDEEVSLPLDRDALAPNLKDHTISQPSLSDIKYILNRWGDRWAGDREQQVRKNNILNSQDHAGSADSSSGLQKVQKNCVQSQDDAEELWDLDLFGAPTYGPGL